MKNAQLKYLMMIVFLFSQNLGATTDAYMVKRNSIKDLFVNSCLEDYVGTKVEIHFEGYCKCVWDKTSLQFTNTELDAMNQEKEPFYSNFISTMKTHTSQCVSRYISPVQDQI